MGGGAPVGYRVATGHQTPFLIDLIVAGVLMSRLLLTDEPPTPYCPHWRPADEVGGDQPLTLAAPCPTLLELYCASCDHEEIKEDRPTG